MANSHFAHAVKHTAGTSPKEKSYLLCTGKLDSDACDTSRGRQHSSATYLCWQHISGSLVRLVREQLALIPRRKCVRPEKNKQDLT